MKVESAMMKVPWESRPVDKSLLYGSDLVNCENQISFQSGVIEA